MGINLKWAKGFSFNYEPDVGMMLVEVVECCPTPGYYKTHTLFVKDSNIRDFIRILGVTETHETFASERRLKNLVKIKCPVCNQLGDYPAAISAKELEKVLFCKSCGEKFKRLY